MPCFSDYWENYHELGLHILPLLPGEKRPRDSEWTTAALTATIDTYRIWAARGPDDGIGLLLGTPIPDTDLYTFAIDVDRPELVEDVRAAIGRPTPTKMGAKGLTFLVQVDREQIQTPPPKAGGIDFLGPRHQTVLPPSRHPQGMEYRWVEPLTRPTDWAHVDIWTLKEIYDLALGRGAHYQAINRLTRSTSDRPGTAHDAVLPFMASAQQLQWPEDVAVARALRAYRDAARRAEEPYPTHRRIEDEEELRGMYRDAAKRFGQGTTTTAPAQGKRGLDERQVAVYILSRLGTCRRLPNDDIAQYIDGRWAIIPLPVLPRIVDTLLPTLNVRQVETICKRVKMLSEELLPILPDPSPYHLAMLNGTVDMRDSSIGPHDPEHWLRHCMTIPWDPELPCPEYFRFMEHLTGDISILEEIAGLALSPLSVIQERIVFLVGPGSTGKTTFVNLVERLLPPGASTYLDLGRLEEATERGRLLNKQLAIAAEIPANKGMSISYLKAITGGETISGRELYRPAFDFRPSAAILGTSNMLPSLEDWGSALHRRVRIVQCNRPVDRPIANFLERILLPEGPGIIARWLRARRILMERGSMGDTAASQAAKQEWLSRGDTVQLWMSDNCEKSEKLTPNQELYADYANWCLINGFMRTQLDSARWGVRLRAQGFDTEKGRAGASFIRGRRLRLSRGGPALGVGPADI